jgi:hypothetical protein
MEKFPNEELKPITFRSHDRANLYNGVNCQRHEDPAGADFNREMVMRAE